MAAGEYVSVSSAGRYRGRGPAKERWELEHYPEGEHHELVGIYVKRGLTPELADQVATQLAAHDAPATTPATNPASLKPRAPPVQAALASAGSVRWALPDRDRAAGAGLQPGLWVTGLSLACLAMLRRAPAQAGRASMLRGAVRVCLWSALAMGSPWAVGHWFGVAVSG